MRNVLLIVGLVLVASSCASVATEESESFSRVSSSRAAASMPSVLSRAPDSGGGFLSGFRARFSDHLQDCGTGLSFLYRSLSSNFHEDVERLSSAFR